jgi:hypothetical protein
LLNHRPHLDVETLENRQLLAAQAPYLGAPFAVGSSPVTIQAEDYDIGGEGVSYHDTNANNVGNLYRTGVDEAVDIKSQASGQHRISDAYVGEWIEYTLDVQQSGNYTLDLRLSNSDPNAKLHVEVDGADVTGALTVPDTNSFNTFATVSKTIALTAGPRVLRVSMDVGAGPTASVAGIDWLRLTRVEDPAPPPQSLVVSKSTLTVNEGSQGSFTVKLATAPTSDVSVSVSKNGGGDDDLSADATTLTFTPANWDVAQTVNIAAAEDDDTTDGQATLTVASSGLSSKTVTATENDNDTPASDPQVTLPTSTAAYVRDGTYANQNFGSASELIVKRSATAGNTRETYLKFDVSELAAGSITGATVRLFGGTGNAAGSLGVAAYGVSNTSWTEGGLTWNTKPASGSTALQTRTISGATGVWYEWDVTSLVQQARSAGAQFVAIAFKATGNTDPWAAFSSDEASSDKPELLVTTAPTAPPPQSIVVSTSALTVAEQGFAPFTVKLATAPPSDVSVTISKNAGGDEDLGADQTTLVFTPDNWNVAQTVNVAAQDDADFTDGQATFTIASSGLASKTVTATEDDNDTPPPPQNLVVSTTNLTVNEASENTFTVKLATAPTSDVTVAVSKNGGGDADLSASLNTLTFTADNWDVAQTVTISAAADADSTDGQATFTVSSSGLTSKNVVATENDDDAPAQPSTIPTTIGAYVRGGTYASTNFGSVNDLVVKNWSNDNETRHAYLKFDLAGVSSIADAKLRVFGRVSGSTGSVAVNVYNAADTSWSESAINWNNKPASGSTVRGAVTFTGSTAKWYDVDVTSFLQSERAAGRTLVTLVLKGAVKASAPVLFSSDETTNRPRLEITPAAAPAQGLVVSTGSVTVDEGSQSPFTVKLATAPTSDVTVTISKNAGGDGDLSVNQTSLTFTAANWDTPQTVNIAAAEDGDTTNGQATFSVASSGLTSKTVTATENDNDAPTPQSLVVSHTALTVNEAGQNTFTVKLATAPTSDVTVTVAKNTGGDPDLSSNKSTLTFTADNWDVAQTVTISAIADPDTTDGSATFAVSSTGLSSKSVVATEDDDDTTRQPGTYYVNLNGNDANAGTSHDAAWQSIAKVNAMTFIPGDTILFRGEQSFNGSIFFNASDTGTSASGALIAPITVGSYGVGSATISSGSASGFFAQNNGGITVQNLNFTGAGLGTNTNDGIAFFNNAAGNVVQNNIKIHDVTVTGYGKNGFGLGGFNGTSGYRNVEITDSQFFENRDGVTFYGPTFNDAAPAYVTSNVRVANVLAYNNHGTSGVVNPTGNGIVFGSVRDGVIERSVAHHNGADNTSSTGPVGIWAYNSDRVTIQHNESYSNDRGTGGDGDGFDFDQNVSNSVMQYNYAHDNDGAGYLIYTGKANNLHDNNVVRYNVSERDGRTIGYGGVVIGGRVTDLDIYNNTIYFPSGTFGTSSAAVYITSIGDRVRLRNNIFYITGGARLISTPDVVNELTFQRNVYYTAGSATAIRWGNSVYSSVSSWLSARTEQERVDLDNNGSLDLAALTANPGLTSAGNGGTIGDANNLNSLSAYKLLSSSPLRDVGLDLKTRFAVDPGTKDFWGTTLKQGSGFDVGADEF